MNLLRRNLPCKIEGKTERTRNRGKKSFPGGKIAIRRGKVIQQWRPHVRQPPGKATSVHVLCHGKAESPNFQKYAAFHPVLQGTKNLEETKLYFSDSFVF